MLIFSASETTFMISMALCYFYSWQTYSLELTVDQQKTLRNRDIIVAVHITEVAQTLFFNTANCASIIATSVPCQILASFFEPIT